MVLYLPVCALAADVSADSISCSRKAVDADAGIAPLG